LNILIQSIKMSDKKWTFLQRCLLFKIGYFTYLISSKGLFNERTYKWEVNVLKERKVDWKANVWVFLFQKFLPLFLKKIIPYQNNLVILFFTWINENPQKMLAYYHFYLEYEHHVWIKSYYETKYHWLWIILVSKWKFILHDLKN